MCRVPAITLTSLAYQTLMRYIQGPSLNELQYFKTIYFWANTSLNAFGKSKVTKTQHASWCRARYLYQMSFRNRFAQVWQNRSNLISLSHLFKSKAVTPAKFVFKKKPFSFTGAQRVPSNHLCLDYIANLLFSVSFNHSTSYQQCDYTSHSVVVGPPTLPLFHSA